jgi:hypothetical protein
MSNKAHSGPAFRSNRNTAKRKENQGVHYVPHPIRWKVPRAIMPFLTGPSNQKKATQEVMGAAIVRYMKFQEMTGKGPKVRAAAA